MKKREPKWRRGERAERVRQFELNGRPQEIFPLLCPVREYEWIPDWECTMAYADSGVAEKDAIFYTAQKPGHRAVWTCITYEPDRLMEYLVVVGTDAVLRLSIALEEVGRDSTAVTWRMLLTALSRVGRHVLSHDYSEARYEEFINRKRQELQSFLDHSRNAESVDSAT